MARPRSTPMTAPPPTSTTRKTATPNVLSRNSTPRLPQQTRHSTPFRCPSLDGGRNDDVAGVIAPKTSDPTNPESPDGSDDRAQRAFEIGVRELETAGAELL